MCQTTAPLAITSSFFRYERIPSDVQEVINHAKLRESDLTAISQPIKIAAVDPNALNLKLLQLDDHLLEELTSGGRVVFKGDRDDNAVLCTSSQTYEIKEAETSNSLLLVPELLLAKDTVTDGETSFRSDNSKSDDQVITLRHDDSADSDILKSPRKLAHKQISKIFYTYYEPRKCKPRLNKLNEVLQSTAYSGPEWEYAIDKNSLVSLDDLKSVIQASDTELVEALDCMKAVKINGYYRMLSFEYEFKVLSQMLDLIEENSWELNCIEKNTTLEALSILVPTEILEILFDFYTMTSDNETLYKYDEIKVCKVFAQYILKDAGKFNLQDFLEVWKNSVPEGMTAMIEMLRGIALYDETSHPQVVWTFPESSLPENINDRFRILFQTKEKWTVEEILPYVEKFTTDKLDVNTLLTKYTRGSTQNNVRYYSSKHSK